MRRYVSTRDSLEALYDRVSPGGLVYIDDYAAYTGAADARTAVSVIRLRAARPAAACEAGPPVLAFAFGNLRRHTQLSIGAPLRLFYCRVAPLNRNHARRLPAGVARVPAAARHPQPPQHTACAGAGAASGCMGSSVLVRKGWCRALSRSACCACCILSGCLRLPGPGCASVA